MKEEIMKAHDRIMMFNILSKLNSDQSLSITEEEQKWLKNNINFLNKIKKQKLMYDAIEYKNLPNKGTIEEIICFLDLSDRMLR